MILYFHQADLNGNPSLGNQVGLSKNLLVFLRYHYALCDTAEVLMCSRGVKTNHTRKGLSKNLRFFRI